MKPTYEQAEDIKNKRVDEEKRVDSCVQANICPVCGSALRRQNQFFGLFHRLVCSVNPVHFNEGGYSDGE